MNKFWGVILFSCLLTACSNKDLYQAGQDYQKSECINNAQNESQQSDCLKADTKPYQEYKKERKAIVNN
ncbi:hypothetical protein ACOYR1_03205 [Thalassotalea piscium]